MKTPRPNGRDGSGGSSAGAAAGGGFRYQAQVTAWWAARILLQTPEVVQRFDLPATAIAVRLSCETGDSVDDIRIDLSDGSSVFGQCKRSLQRSKGPETIFGKVFLQFIEETAKCLASPREQRNVLFYERHSGPLDRLRRILDRYRGLSEGSTLDEAVKTKEDLTIVAELNALLNSLLALPDLREMDRHRETVLRRIHVMQLAVSPGEVHYLGLVDSLRSALLARPEQIHLVVRSLHELGDELIETHGSTDRVALRKRLQGLGVELQDSIDFRADFGRLDVWSQDAVAAEQAQGRDKLSVAGRQLTIRRPIVPAMQQAAMSDSFLVVGEAGTGKTGCLLALAKQLKSAGCRVWYCATNPFFKSLQQIREDASLEHRWDELLQDSSSGIESTLLIDGLDGLRDSQASKAYRELIALALKHGLKVIASIRTFDLHYSFELRKLFRATSGPLCDAFTETALKDVKHFAVRDLDEDELAQVTTTLPEVSHYLDSSDLLKEVCSNLFFLSLLCELSESDSPMVPLAEIRSRAELFDRWWEHIVLSDARREECIGTLRSIVETMIDQRILSVSFNQWATEVKNHLFSSGVLVEPHRATNRLRRSDQVAFRHHYLFDHAAMKLFVESRQGYLERELVGSINWALFLRPSLTLFFRYAWTEGREDFWELISRLETDSVMFFHKVPACLAVATEAVSIDDLRPMLEATRWSNHPALVQRIVTTARYHSLGDQFMRARGDCWLELATELIGIGEASLVHAGRMILAYAAESCATLSESARKLLNRGSRDLFYYCQRTPGWEHDTAQPIGWICLTIAACPHASKELINAILSQEQLQSVGYIQAPALASHIKVIWHFDSSLAVDAYQAIFSFQEEDNSEVLWGSSAIMRISSTRRDDYQIGRYRLREEFPNFLHAHPARASRAICRIMKSLGERLPRTASARFTETFTWLGKQCRIDNDTEGVWFEQPMPEDDERKMLSSWEDFVGKLPHGPAADELWDSVAMVLCAENESACVWRSLLKAACESPEFFAVRLAPLLLSTRIIFGPGTRTFAVNCIRRFAPHLDSHHLNGIQTVVLRTTEYSCPGSDTPLNEEWLQEHKVRALCAISRESRTVEVQEFLAACDQELVRLSEDRERDSDRIYEGVSAEVRRRMSTDPSEGAGIAVPEGAFLEDLNPGEITKGNVDEIVGRILEIYRSEESANDEIRHQGVPLRHWCLRALASVSNSGVSDEALPLQDLFTMFQSWLVAPCEKPSDLELEAFDDSPTWGEPDLLVASTRGFLGLVTRSSLVDAAQFDLLRRVAAHPRPEVRIQLVEAFRTLVVCCPVFVFETVEQWVREACEGPGTLALVAMTIFGETFRELRNNDTERADRLAEQFYDAAHSRGSVSLRENCGRFIGRLYVYLGEEWAWQRISEVTKSVVDNLAELNGIVSEAARTCLSISWDSCSDDVFERASEALRLCLGATQRAIAEYFHSRETSDQSGSDSPQPEWVREAAHLSEHVAAIIAGHAEDASGAAEVSTQEVTRLEASEWLDRVQPVIEILIGQPYTPVSYLLIHGLKELVRVVPERVLPWLERITQAAEAYGITLESAAMNDTVEILETLIADQSLDLRSEEVLSNIVQITDRYLRAGWPRAFEFATRLEGVFR